MWACFDTENAEFWTAAVTAGREYMQKVVDSNGVCPYQAWDGVLYMLGMLHVSGNFRIW